jgi:hypothetical protein
MAHAFSFNADWNTLLPLMYIMLQMNEQYVAYVKYLYRNIFTTHTLHTTHHMQHDIHKPSVSVVYLSPDYLWRKVSRWVSCYAFFQ